ncbi:uncharacterized protein LOC109834492 isoform X1 [Asparagus officinalis]|uniref:uncharacterized protein LOC109834492 isoform X1 n=1 Tax=Asparagus officinalis TaxID=4686 RepID=UPI00098E081A|nr:uncharacterized protein LOC109834492 isoform X1 [Asparagus officinalis]
MASSLLFSCPLHLSSSPKPSSISAARRSSSLPLSSSDSSEEKKRVVLERYGLDPSEFISEPHQRRGRRREEQMKLRKREKGRAAPPRLEERKPPRTTHKLLKVLGGKARRKKLLSPEDRDVRPMMEVVRGAAFDMLQVAGGCPAALRPGRWLDLYSGTGAVGIEAISRGCSEAHFVEMDPWVVSEVLRPNLELTGFTDVSMVHTSRVENFLEQAVSRGEDGSFDYVSVTPPYTAVDYGVLLAQLERSPLIGEDCFILVEYPLKTSMPDSCGHLIKITDRRFGRTNLIVYGPEWAQKKKRSERTLLTKSNLL